MHARFLSLRLRRVMLAAIAAPALAACGGVVDNGDAGTDAESPDAWKPPPNCTAETIDGGLACGGKEMQLSGDISKCNVVGDAGEVPTSSCQAICGGSQYSFCSFDSSTNVLSCEGMCVGRLPARLRKAHATATSAVGEYLARAAYLEAAAVDAFAILAAELRAHGAPESLVRSAHRAGADEVRHAREVGDLARSFGAEVPRPEVARTGVRPLLEIAIENAVEGCVRETFGALVASWQAEHARAGRVRAAMKRIARDETRHAALGWRIFEWAQARLSPAERAEVERAMARAIDELEASCRVQPDGGVALALGLPSAAEASALCRAMRGEVWPTVEPVAA